MYEKLVAEVNNMNTSGFVLKTKYVADKSDLQKKIRDTSGLFKNTYYNSKITEIESKIPTISGLATNAPLTTVGNKIAKIRKLVKKQIRTQKLLDLKKNLVIMIMINILLPQNLLI